MATKIYGIDLSVHNTVSSFQAIKNSGKSFVFLRLGWANSNGTITKDTKFDEYYKNALSVGLDIGVYVFSYLKDITYAKIAAQNTIKLIKDLVITMPVAFDYENADISKTLTKEQNTAICKAYLSEIQVNKYFAMFYTYTSFIQSYININELSGYALWIADYREKTGTVCPYKGTWGIWQYAGDKNGTCQGVLNACDLNIAVVDYASVIKSKKLNNYKDSVVTPIVNKPVEIIPVTILSPYKGKFKISQTFKGTTHQGLDLVGIDSKNLYATVTGKVEIAGNNDPNGFGIYVRILASDGCRYYYGHMSSVAVKVGDIVTVGQFIGIEGSTGHSTGSHCHYEVRTNSSKSSFADINKISGIPNELGIYEDKSIKIDTKKLIINSGTWNIRNTNSLNGKVLTTVKAGQMYEYTKIVNDWAYIPSLNGWISKTGYKFY